MKRVSAMEFFQPFLAVLVILQESIKLLSKNQKLIALTFVPSLLLSSLIFIVYHISAKSMFDDMFTSNKVLAALSFTGEFTPEFASAVSGLQRDTGFLLLVNLSFALATWLISILSVTSIILISAISNTNRTLSFKDFALLVVRTCIRPVITAFYSSLLGLGYFFFVLAISAPIFMFSEFGLGRVPTSIILFGICAYISYLYLSMTWTLSLVVSVVEENCYGIEALGKAADLIRGKRFQGFLLSAIFAASSLVAFKGLESITNHRWLVNETVSWLILLNFFSLVKLLVFLTYTVLYFHCKKHHGEEIELQEGSADQMYKKISDAPLAGHDMA